MSSFGMRDRIDEQKVNIPTISTLQGASPFLQLLDNEEVERVGGDVGKSAKRALALCRNDPVLLSQSGPD